MGFEGESTGGKNKKGSKVTYTRTYYAHPRAMSHVISCSLGTACKACCCIGRQTALFPCECRELRPTTAEDEAMSSTQPPPPPPPPSPSGISRMCSAGGHGTTGRRYATLSEGSGDQPYPQSVLEAAYVPRDAESEWANAACACAEARDAVVVWKSVTFYFSRQRHEHRF